jgi:hypothetical protein
LARGEGGDILLYVKTLPAETREVFITSYFFLTLIVWQDDFEFLGLCVENVCTEDGLATCNESLFKFAQYMCTTIFKPQGAKYFSLQGTNGTKNTMETLPFPSEYLSGFIGMMYKWLWRVKSNDLN